MTDWIAQTPDQYLEIALEKAAADLSELRAGLPARVGGSVLGDTVRYTRELEAFYRRAWRNWCEHVAPATEGAT